jgi:hypothetical protein
MKQPMIFRNEDIKLRDERIDATEQALTVREEGVYGLKNTGKLEMGFK